VGSLDLILGGVRISFQGSGTFPWASRLTSVASEYVTFSDTWRHRTRPCGGVRCCCWPRVVTRGWGESWPGPTYRSFTTGLKIAAWVLCFYIAVRGTLVLGYRQWPPGPPQGRMRACRWGQTLYFSSTWPDRWLARCFSMSADAPAINPPLVTSTAISVSAAN
jgi:hypothetical protein